MKLTSRSRWFNWMICVLLTSPCVIAFLSGEETKPTTESVEAKADEAPAAEDFAVPTTPSSESAAVAPAESKETPKGLTLEINGEKKEAPSAEYLFLKDGEPFQFSAGFDDRKSSPPRNYTMKGNVAVTWNKENTVFWGYSNTLGKWANIVLPKDAGQATPYLEENVIALQLKDRIYGFSASVGQWNELKVKQPEIKLDQDKIVVRDGETIHIFSEKTGRWASSGNDQAALDEDRVLFFNNIQQDFKTNQPAVKNKPKNVTLQMSGINPTTIDIVSDHESIPNLWRRRADLYQRSAAELLASIQSLEKNKPESKASIERMTGEYNELIQLTVDARLNAQKEDAKQLKSRFERIEAQINENEQKKSERIEQLDKSIRGQARQSRNRPSFQDVPKENIISDSFEKKEDKIDRENPRLNEAPSDKTEKNSEYIP